jgi:alpha-glutamyl/putrescinyl thymine pyrophosphorylase clade 1
MKTKQLFDFILERWQILQRRTAGESAPWTKDPILGKYRFCNVYREDDKVTRWIAQNLREPLQGEWNLIPVMAAARFINRISTLEKLKDILLEEGWHPKACPAVLKDIKKSGQPIITGAYMVKTPVGLDKITGLNQILVPINKQFKTKVYNPCALEILHADLLMFPWLGGFMAAQIVADVKYAEEWKQAPDWWTFAASGPGSRRGLNRVLGHPVDSSWKEEDWKREALNLRTEIIPYFKRAGMPLPHTQEVNNMCCEFDKYERARLGEGEPKQRYNPA